MTPTFWIAGLLAAVAVGGGAQPPVVAPPQPISPPPAITTFNGFSFRTIGYGTTEIIVPDPVKAAETTRLLVEDAISRCDITNLDIGKAAAAAVGGPWEPPVATFFNPGRVAQVFVRTAPGVAPIGWVELGYSDVKPPITGRGGRWVSCVVTYRGVDWRRVRDFVQARLGPRLSQPMVHTPDENGEGIAWTFAAPAGAPWPQGYTATVGVGSGSGQNTFVMRARGPED